MKTPRTVAILGAGCAGTLLALELRRQRFTGRIELLDARESFDREQRWCFWRERGAPTPGVDVDHEWTAWRVRDHGREEIIRASSQYVYSHVHAPAFFRKSHASLLEDPAVELRLGCRVNGVTGRRAGGYRVATEHGDVDADEIIDARHRGSAAFSRQIAGTGIGVWQSFTGRLGEFPAGRLDPKVATLMDFRLRRADGLAFGYVLPFDANRALVEVAVLGPEPVPLSRLDTLLDEYLETCCEGTFTASGVVEQGLLPMTTARFSPGDRSGIVSIGVGGGSARPSSGYAFARILRATPALAHAVCAGQPPAVRRLPWKYRWMDETFLRLLRERPDIVRQSFLTMFAEVPADRLIRFLTETSSIPDDLALGWKLPKSAFIRASLRLPAPARCQWTGTSASPA